MKRDEVSRAIALSDLTVDHAYQAREGTDAEVVREYAERIQAGDAFPPIIVLHMEGERFVVIDGFHRVAALQTIGADQVLAIVRDASEVEAIELAISANRDHGKRRTHADVRAAITMALRSSLVERSDSWLAKIIGCTNETVRAQRERLESTCEIRKLDELLGEDGKKRPRSQAKAAALDVIAKKHWTIDEWSKLSAKDKSRIFDHVAQMADGPSFNRQDQPENESMGNIEWARWSWNPVTGCRHGCSYCYARDITERFGNAFPNGFEPTFWPERLAAARLTSLPGAARDEVAARNVFSNSMSDLYGRWVPDEWINATLDVMRAAPDWNFLMLTKFPKKAAEFAYSSNCWIGTSVDLQARVKAAEDAFSTIECGVRWLSIEPLIEPLKFTRPELFQWVVIGGASRSSKTPAWTPPFEWVVRVASQFLEHGARIYLKTNGRPREYPGVITPERADDAFHYLKRAM